MSTEQVVESKTRQVPALADSLKGFGDWQDPVQEKDFNLIAQPGPMDATLSDEQRADLAFVLRTHGFLQEANVNSELSSSSRRARAALIGQFYNEANGDSPDYSEAAAKLLNGNIIPGVVRGEEQSYHNRSEDKVRSDIDYFVMFSLATCPPEATVALLSELSQKQTAVDFANMKRRLEPTIKKYMDSSPFDADRSTRLESALKALGLQSPELNLIYPLFHNGEQPRAEDFPEPEVSPELTTAQAEVVEQIEIKPLYPNYQHLGTVLDYYRRNQGGEPLPEGLPQLTDAQFRFLEITSQSIIANAPKNENGDIIDAGEDFARNEIVRNMLDQLAMGDSSLLSLLPKTNEDLTLFKTTVVDLVADKYRKLRQEISIVKPEMASSNMTFEMSNEFRALRNELATFIPSQIRALEASTAEAGTVEAGTVAPSAPTNPFKVYRPEQ